MALSEKQEARYNAAISYVLERGMAMKSKKKEAFESLGYIYKDIRETVNDETNMAHCWDIPFDLHHVREKHAVFFGKHWDRVQELVETRQQIKDLPVETREAKVAPEEQIRKTVLKTYEERRDQYDLIKGTMETLVEFVGDKTLVKGVSVHAAYCSNYFGTNWVRFDWYLQGRRVPFQMILGSIDAIRSERAGN